MRRGHLDIKNTTDIDLKVHASTTPTTDIMLFMTTFLCSHTTYQPYDAQRVRRLKLADSTLSRLTSSHHRDDDHHSSFPNSTGVVNAQAATFRHSGHIRHDIKARANA